MNYSTMCQSRLYPDIRVRLHMAVQLGLLPFDSQVFQLTLGTVRLVQGCFNLETELGDAKTIGQAVDVRKTVLRQV